MKKLFWGIFFVYLNFNLTLNGHRVNLLPDFVGYILLILGIGELSEESGYFDRARPFAIGMTVYSAIIWLGALFAVGSDGVLALLLPVAAMAVSLYISRLLIGGVREMEENEAECWGGYTLLGRWKLLLAVQVVSYLMNLAAKLVDDSSLYALAALTSLVSMLCIVIYLLAWYRTWIAYESAGKKEASDTDEE